MSGIARMQAGQVVEILILQHADKEPTPDDPGLSVLGQHQAATAAVSVAALTPVAVYSSPARRTRQTAEIMAAACGLEVVPDPRLAERMNWTSPSGLTWPQFLAEWARSSADRNYVPAGGESSRRAGERLAAALSELAASYRGGLVLVVSHGGVTVDFLRAVLGDDELARRAPGFIAQGLPACAFTRLRWVPGAWEVLAIGDDRHMHGNPGAAWHARAGLQD